MHDSEKAKRASETAEQRDEQRRVTIPSIYYLYACPVLA